MESNASFMTDAMTRVPFVTLCNYAQKTHVSWSLYSQSAPIGWFQSANRLEFPIGSIGWWRRSADRLWQTRLPASGRPISCSGLKKKSSSQKCSHQNSVQNAPIGIFTALMGTIFVTVSVFMSQAHFWAIFGPSSSIGQADQGWKKSMGSIGQGWLIDCRATRLSRRNITSASNGRLKEK